MVLLSRPDPSAASSSSRVFTGNDDIEMFFCLFENVVTQEKIECKRAQELLANTDKDSFQFLLRKHTLNGGIRNAWENHVVVVKAFLEKFSRALEL